MAIQTVNGGTVTGLPVTASASNNTKGAWTEITASTSEQINGLMLSLIWSNAPGRTYLIDIGTGGSGAETVLIENILMAQNPGAGLFGAMSAYYPVSVSAGTRLSVRMQSNVGSSATNLSLYLFGGTGAGSVVTYGTSTATSTGTTIDPGAVANTKGAYSEITAATTADHDYIGVVIAAMPSAPPGNATCALDIATGASGSETVIVSNVLFGSAESSIWIPKTWWFPVSVASGTRLAVRAQSDNTNASSRVFQLALYGATMPTGSSGGGAFAYAFMG